MVREEDQEIDWRGVDREANATLVGGCCMEVNKRKVRIGVLFDKEITKCCILFIYNE